LPDVLRKYNKGDSIMTLEQIEKKVEEQDAQLAAIKAENDVLKHENEAVLKMTKKERGFFAAMPEEKRKEYMAADEEKRAAMIAACEKAAAKDEEGSAAEEAAETAEEEAKEKEKEKANKALIEKVAKAEERVAKTEQELATIRKRERLLVFAKRAEDELPHSPGSPEEKGARLLKLAEALGGEEGEDFKKTLADLKSADRALAMHFGEVGKAGGSVPAEKAWDAKVEEIAKRDSVTVGKATAKAMQECPEMYLDYERQHRQYAVQQ
jgi:flagellar biosynthesis GTPase FlhF